MQENTCKKLEIVAVGDKLLLVVSWQKMLIQNHFFFKFDLLRTFTIKNLSIFKSLGQLTMVSMARIICYPTPPEV